MQVQVNVKAAAKRVKKFIEASGGSTTHSEVLELLSEVCGFDSYRALQAASAPTAKATKAPAALVTEQDGRSMESAQSVVFSATAVDWQLAGNPHISFDEVPQERRTPYDFIVEQDGSQFRVLLKPVGVHLDNFEGKPVLDMLVEVNEGLPCVHLTNDPADCMLATVFSTGQGLLLREDGGEWMRGDDVYAPEGLKDLALEVSRGSELHEAHFAILDTAEKYREFDKPVEGQPAPVPATPCEPTPATVVLPYARTNLVHPVRRNLVGSYVEVEFTVPKSGQYSWNGLKGQVRLFDEEGVCGDEDEFLLFTRLTADTAPDILKKLADSVAQFVAFFIEAGYDMGDMNKLLTEPVSGDNPHVKVAALLNVAEKAETRHDAYKTLKSVLLA